MIKYFLLLLFPLALLAQKPAETNTLPCQLFPSNNIWNTPIDNLPVDANSAAYVQTIGASKSLHPDFGSGEWNGGPIGIPYVVVPGSQAKVDVVFEYDGESDQGPYPVPADAPVEGGPDSDGDRHILIVDKDNCILYELYHCYPQQGGSWTAGSGAIFDLNSNTLRPDGWTSADAAGLPILPGLVRYDEVAEGAINHAIRLTVPQTRRAYIWPARHYASSLTDTKYPPLGQRFRLKAAFDISAYPADARVILIALKKYGMILADNGSQWFISGAPDERWNNDTLNTLKNLKGSDFEAVDVSSLMIDKNSGEAKQEPNSVDDQKKTIEIRQGTDGVSFEIPETAVLSIFDLRGTEIFRSTADKGSLYWDYTTGAGVRISNGIYFVVVQGTTTTKAEILYVSE